MILTDLDIRKAIAQGQIDISDFDTKRLGSNSYDLTLSDKLMVCTEPELDCARQNAAVMWTIPSDGYVLQPAELYLGCTTEYTASRVYAPFIEGKSSVGRLGISVHVTAGVGDIGFQGHWTLEITCVKPVRIYAGMPIAQILFLLPLGKCGTPYNLKGTAKYHNQPGEPMPSQMWMNFKQTTAI
jgi:dCTP deaminase